MTDCGGCAGLGAHQRWCVEAVGPSASRMGKQAQQAENLADSVGSNNMGAANALYHAAGLLRADALERAERYRNRTEVSG